MTSTLVIDGHPNPESLTAAMAERYVAGNGNARLLRLRELDFDPNLRFGYRGRIPIEPDLADAREALHAASRIVVASPMWWGSAPALLKGFFDRALLPHEEYEMTPLGFPRGLLAGRSGRLLLLSDTPGYALPFMGTPAAAQIGRRTLKFCGVRPFRVHRFMGVGAASEGKISRWLETSERIGAGDRQRDAGRPDETPKARSAVLQSEPQRT